MTTSSHLLYTAEDFTNEELDRRNQLAVLVVEGGLGVCKKCGAAEVELDDYKTCEAYRSRPRETVRSTAS